MAKENSLETSTVDSPASSQDENATNHNEEGGGLELKAPATNLDIQKIEIPVEKQHEECREKNFMAHHPIIAVDENEVSTPYIKEARHEDKNPCEEQKTDFLPHSDTYTHKHKEDDHENENSSGPNMEIFLPSEKHKSETEVSLHIGSVTDNTFLNSSVEESEVVDENGLTGRDVMNKKDRITSEKKSEDDEGTEENEEMIVNEKEKVSVSDGTEIPGTGPNRSLSCQSLENISGDQSPLFPITSERNSEDDEGTDKNEEIVVNEEEKVSVSDGTESPVMGPNKSLSCQSLDNISGDQRSLFPEKAVAITNFVRVKSAVAVSSVLRHLSVKRDDEKDIREEDIKHISDAEQMEDTNNLVELIPMKGRILLYTRLGCQDCKEVRLFLHLRRLRYVEINIDVYPGRNCELEKFSGSPAVPKVFFNEVLIGGLSELKELDESGELKGKIEYVTSEAPPFEAPLPPLSGEDDLSGSGSIDELALIVRNMKNHIVVKDRFYKMRRFSKTFMGSEAVAFVSEDQYLEREEAIQFGRKLAQKLFFQHVLEENVFEDSHDLYRFLDDDPFISQCQNIPRGIIEVKPKPIADISSRLRFMCCAIFEAYTSKDGNHVDYRSIHGSEEFARYLRIMEELQRVDLHGMPREEKLAFFINLYNMMAIHAILVWGHPAGSLERKKLFGEFKYVIGGCMYSLSDIQNGILRGNQRTPYTLTKPFGGKDKRSAVALSYPEPLVHFALVCGTCSGPALRCYSSGDIDKELMEAAHKFLRNGGLTVDVNAKIASVNKILKWYRADFGKNENEALKHAANYLEPLDSQTLLELLDETQLKVVYQPYDWKLNN